ncbi:MAG: glycine C-acetyltransferase [Desulfamplus sp.]|nr:glycine C-acetyltransferase [Desulfamplus sp.]
MAKNFLDHLKKESENLKSQGLYKQERILTSRQKADITVAGGTEVINFCANNYLGLADSPGLIEAAKKGLDSHGFGMASVRFICGTQDIHKTLEKRISTFLKTEDAILYSSCFDANAGLFETLFGPEDAIVSDALNHASIIDGVRLCKARRYRYKNNDMQDLKVQLETARSQGARFIVIATDGVFSMDGIIADLKGICDLAEKYDALVMVDDSHAVGFMGKNGAGTPEHCGVQDRVDILTGTLGKALGGASGGYTAGPGEIIDILRQRSRPYLFSNTLAPPIVAASIKAIDMIAQGDTLRRKLKENSTHFRDGMEKLGFTLIPGEHPIIPIMLWDAPLAGRMAKQMLGQGIYVVGFSFPVVPKGQARIRTQISAAHEPEHIDRAIAAFAATGHNLGIIKL